MCYNKSSVIAYNAKGGYAMKNYTTAPKIILQFFFTFSLILLSIGIRTYASAPPNNMQDLINQLNQISQQNTNPQTKNKKMNNIMQKFSKELENMNKSINPNNPVESLNTIKKIGQKLTIEKPCSWFHSMPKSSTLTHCFPISVNVSYNMYEKNIGNLDRPEEADEIKWTLDNQLMGELTVFTKPGCRKISKKCLNHFALNAPGTNTAGIKNTRVILRNGYAKYLIGDGRGNTRMTTSGTGKFYTHKKQSKGDMGSISFGIYPSNTKSHGNISIPVFGWIDIHNEKHEPGAGWLLQDALYIEDKNDISKFALDFLPSFEDIMKLLKTQSYKYQSPVNIKVKDYIAKGNIKYDISLKLPGRLKVTPSSDFVATRSSPKKRYKPRSKKFTLTNTGKSKLTYKISENANWLTIKSKKIGTIKPHQKIHVKIALTNAADKLKRGRYKTPIYFEDLSNATKISKKAILKNREKWRFTIFQKDSITRGGNSYFAGVIAKVKTDIDIDIEDGKYKKGIAKAKFLSIKTTSFPIGVSDCSVQKYWFTNNSYPIAGKVLGGSVKLEVTPSNDYTIIFDCLIDKDKLKDSFFNIREKNRKGNRVRVMNQKVKRSIDGNTVIFNRTWKIITLTDKEIQERAKNIKRGIENRVVGLLQYEKNNVITPMYPNPSRRTIIVPLKNFTKNYGTLKSINFNRIKMQQIE